MSNQVNLAVARPIAFDPTMRPPQQRPNPVLEGIRQEATEAAQRQEDAWYRVDGELACELRRLHASWLCYSEGNECLRVLCRVMTSVPSRTVPGDWLALAAKLGLSNTEIMSIVQKQSHVNMDSMQFVIWTYSQNTNANLYQIVNSLEALERYDALRMLREHFQQLVDGVNLLVEIDGENFIYERINPAEAGATAANLDEFLVAPKNYQRDIRRLLPLSLQNQAPARNTEIVVRRTNDNARPIAVQHEHLVTRQNTTNDETLPQPTATISPKIPKVNVFLTFAADGADFAERIAKKMRTAVGDRPEFGVLILQEGENAEKVLRNPEIIINQLFPQFHFICPILTLGYLKTINTPLIDSGNVLDAQLELRSALDSLDACYVRFIHNLMMNEYTVNNCRNSRFRCIIPKVDDETQRQILAKMRQPGILNPTLRAWAYEKDLENFLRRLIGLY